MIAARGIRAVRNKGNIQPINVFKYNNSLQECRDGRHVNWPPIGMMASQIQLYSSAPKKVPNWLNPLNSPNYKLCTQSSTPKKPASVPPTTPTSNPNPNPIPNPSTPTEQATIPPSTSKSSSSTANASTPDSCNNSKTSSESVQIPDIKMPSRDQLEQYFFRATVMVWDAAVYVYAVGTKLGDQYILKNATFQQYWNIFKHKMDNARKEMKK